MRCRVDGEIRRGSSGVRERRWEHGWGRDSRNRCVARVGAAFVHKRLTTRGRDKEIRAVGGAGVRSGDAGSKTPKAASSRTTQRSTRIQKRASGRGRRDSPGCVRFHRFGAMRLPVGRGLLARNLRGWQPSGRGQFGGAAESGRRREQGQAVGLVCRLPGQLHLPVERRASSPLRRHRLPDNPRVESRNILLDTTLFIISNEIDKRFELGIVLPNGPILLFTGLQRSLGVLTDEFVAKIRDQGVQECRHRHQLFMAERYAVMIFIYAVHPLPPRVFDNQ